MSTFFGISFIIGIVAVIAVGIIAIVIASYISKISKSLLGTENVVKGIVDLKEKTDYEMENSVKSVSAMTNIYLPKIKKDFPEFNYDEMKSRAQTVLLSYLRALDCESIEDLKDVTVDFRRKVENQIVMGKGDRINEHYRNPKLHRTEISNYVNRNGQCIVTFQTAIQYNYYKVKDGKTIAGGQDKVTQSRYDIDCIYIQDRDIVMNTMDEGFALNCPNCGAPVKGVGAKSCSYCGSPIVEFNIKTWSFSDVRRTSST